MVMVKIEHTIFINFILLPKLFVDMNTLFKSLFACLLFPTLLIGQKLHDKPVWSFDLQFDFAKADLKSEYFPRLDSLVVALQDSTFVVYLKAHTDAVGDAKANFELSQKRAQSVKNYLTNKNTPESRINTEGYGESQPLGENESDEGRRLNRRVSVSVMRRLAQVTGIVIDSISKTPIANAKVILLSKYLKDSVLTDANGAYTLSARLNLGAKIRIVTDDCPQYDGQIFMVNSWTTKQDAKLKCKSKPTPSLASTTMPKPVVTPKRVLQKVTISGTVKNDSSKIVQHARLVFSYENSKDTVFSDEKGHYSVSNMMYPDVRVSISANNHLPFYQGIIADSSTKLVDFKIQTIAAGKKAALKNINFYTSSATVMPESNSAMEELLQFMKANNKCVVEIGGHITAYSSSSPYPEGSSMHILSTDRAKTVFDYLEKNGIETNRMTYKGYSNFNMVIESPTTEEEHKANRRVEIKILRDGQ